MRIASFSKLKELINVNQQKIILLVGFVAVSTISFGLGRSSSSNLIQNAQAGLSVPSNYSSNSPTLQSAETTNSANQSGLDCTGKIKGSASLIYHLPGGAFYNKTTNPISCFNTEAEAKAAGFRKSSR